MCEHHVRAAVEAVLHSDRPAGKTPSAQVPHIHRPGSDGAAHSVPASRGRHTPSQEDDTTVQIWTVWCLEVSLLMERAPDMYTYSVFAPYSILVRVEKSDKCKSTYSRSDVRFVTDIMK